MLFFRVFLATESTENTERLMSSSTKKSRKVDVLVNHINDEDVVFPDFLATENTEMGCRFSGLSNTQAFLAVFIILNILPPLLIFQIPGNGFPDSCSECFGRIPTQVFFNFCSINGIA